MTRGVMVNLGRHTRGFDRATAVESLSRNNFGQWSRSVRTCRPT